VNVLERLNPFQWFAKELIGAESVGDKLDHYGAFEQIQVNNNICYAVAQKGKPILYMNELSHGDYVYKPIRKVPWSLPSQPKPYGTELELWNEVRGCMGDHLDHPDPASYDVLTAWVFATYMLERWQAVPYLFFYGAHETGKTRALEIVSALSFRGWLALYVTPANLYRPLEAWKPTLFLDEAEVYGDMKDVLALLNGSYRRGQLIARQVETVEGYKTVFFDNFGFKCLAGTRSLATTLQSRCIIFRMSRATRKIRLFLDQKRIAELKSKLLMYRLHTICGDGGDGGEGVPERGVDVEVFAEKIGSGRLAELFYPLYVVAPNDELRASIIEYALEVGKGRLEELRVSEEVIVLTAILEAERRRLCKQGKILIKDITDIVNEQLSMKEWLSNRYISSLCSRIGFQRTSVHGGLSAIKWDDKLIERLKTDPRYASCFEAPPLSPEPSPPYTPSPSWLEKVIKDEKHKGTNG